MRRLWMTCNWSDVCIMVVSEFVYFSDFVKTWARVLYEYTSYSNLPLSIVHTILVVPHNQLWFNLFEKALKLKRKFHILLHQKELALAPKRRYLKTFAVKMGLRMFILKFWWRTFTHYQCSSQKILLEGQSGPYNPFLGARYFKKGLMYQYLSNICVQRYKVVPL